MSSCRDDRAASGFVVDEGDPMVPAAADGVVGLRLPLLDGRCCWGVVTGLIDDDDGLPLRLYVGEETLCLDGVDSRLCDGDSGLAVAGLWIEDAADADDDDAPAAGADDGDLSPVRREALDSRFEVDDEEGVSGGVGMLFCSVLCCVVAGRIVAQLRCDEMVQ